MNLINLIFTKLLYFSFVYLPKSKFFDKILCFLQFFLIHKRFPSNQKIFNDVLYKIKTSNEIDDPLRVFTTDKEFCKIFLEQIIDEKFVVPSLLITNKIDEIENFKITNNCIIKPTHLAGICIYKKKNDKINDIDKIKIKKWLLSNHYLETRERNYLNLKSKIIIEPLLFDNFNLTDFKFFCYNGKAKIIMLDSDIFLNKSRTFFDLNWNKLEISLGNFEKNNSNYIKPKNLDEMITLSEKISKYFKFIRVDLFSDGNTIFVGDITHIHAGATQRFTPNDFISEKEFSKFIFNS